MRRSCRQTLFFWLLQKIGNINVFEAQQRQIIKIKKLGAITSIVNKYWKFHVIASSNIGSLLQHHFIYAELEELYLVNQKKVLILQFNSKTLKDTKLQN